MRKLRKAGRSTARRHQRRIDTLGPRSSTGDRRVSSRAGVGRGQTVRDAEWDLPTREIEDSELDDIITSLKLDAEESSH